MKRIVFIITLLLFSGTSYAEDCFDMAGRDYKIDPDLLRAISWQESKFVVDAIGRNPVSGYGSGLMQIDSQHFGELSRYGIKSQHLLTDACLNIYTGAYFLARAFKKWGGVMGCGRRFQCRIQKKHPDRPHGSIVMPEKFTATIPLLRPVKNRLTV